MSFSKEDWDLWQAFLKETKPLKKTPQKVAALAGKTGRKQNFTKEISLSSPLLEDFPHPLSSQEASSSLLYQGRRKLKRPKTLDATLDLHGLTQKEAFHQLTSFLTQCYRGQKRVVLVVTGKGFKRLQEEPSSGVLRENLPLWLTHPQLQSLIQYYTSAHLYDGGQGAYYIYLKNIKKFHSF